MEEATPVTVVNVLQPTSIESAPTTAAPVTVVNDDVIEVPESSSIPIQRKGKDKDASKNDAEDDNSDSSCSDDDSDAGKNGAGDTGKNVAGNTGDSDDGLLDIFPTPVKKQSGIDRLQRGRKIKASSPAGRKYPTRTCFDLLFAFV